MKSANFSNDPYLRDYGLSVSNKMETVRGRVLQAPHILYQGERSVSVMGAYDYMDFCVYKVVLHFCACNSNMLSVVPTLSVTLTQLIMPDIINWSLPV